MKFFKATSTAAVAAAAGIITLQSAAMAVTYEAYCGGGKNSCKVSIDAAGVSGPSGFIPAGGVLQWYQGGEGDTNNIAASVIGGTAGGVTGAVVGAIATCWTIVLCPVGFFGGMGAGIAGGGSAGKRSEHTFTVIGYTEEGKKISEHFWFVNKRPAAKVLQSLAVMTGLAMGQIRPMETIARALKIELTEETETPIKAGDAPALIGEAKAKSEPVKNCWSTYLENNPNMKIWAEANPGAAAQNKKRFDDC